MPGWPARGMQEQASHHMAGPSSATAMLLQVEARLLFIKTETGQSRHRCVQHCQSYSYLHLHPKQSAASPAAPARVVTLPADTMRMTLLACTQAREAHLISACRETDSNTSPLLSFQ